MEGRAITPATFGDVVELGVGMREADRLEVRASTGRDPRDAVRESFEGSKEAWSLRIDGELICMWGVADIWDDLLAQGVVGVVWMLTTDAIERHKGGFIKAAHEFFPTLFERWGTLVNAVDIRHEKALRWGERMGFVFLEPRPFGFEGRDFRLFTVTLEDYLCAQSQQSPR